VSNFSSVALQTPWNRLHIAYTAPQRVNNLRRSPRFCATSLLAPYSLGVFIFGSERIGKSSPSLIGKSPPLDIYFLASAKYYTLGGHGKMGKISIDDYHVTDS
jgi:hypothetical protein